MVLFEHPKHMLKLMGKKIFTILCSKMGLSKTCVAYLRKVCLHPAELVYLINYFKSKNRTFDEGHMKLSFNFEP